MKSKPSELLEKVQSKKYKCGQCGLVVDKIPTWKDKECLADEHQHRFTAVNKKDRRYRSKYI